MAIADRAHESHAVVEMLGHLLMLLCPSFGVLLHQLLDVIEQLDRAYRAPVPTLKCCAVRAIVMLLVVIGDGLEPAANTLLLHVSLVLQ